MVNTCDYYLFCFIQGPNYVWHCDGYDKLKPYGFPIHGCIDGLVLVFYVVIVWIH